jgi:Beta/Gamma crystallin
MGHTVAFNQSRGAYRKATSTSSQKEATMLLSKMFFLSGLIAMGALSVEAAELEKKLVDKNCWVEVFDDNEYDFKDAHAKFQGPKEYATLNNLDGKDWNNDIESVIVGSGATVRAYKERDFQGPELVLASDQRVPDLAKLNMANDIESLKITCEKSDTQNQLSSDNKAMDQNSDRTGMQSSDRQAPQSSSTTTTTTTTTVPSR